MLLEPTVKTAFLHGILPENETVYMEQPSGFKKPGKHDWVMKLMKSLYGMKQASCMWNLTFHKAVTQMGFQRLANEWCMYHWWTNTGTTIFAVHVDDIIATSTTPKENNSFK
jgi:reverse transcriptase-like protein